MVRVKIINHGGGGGGVGAGGGGGAGGASVEITVKAFVDLTISTSGSPRAIPPREE